MTDPIEMRTRGPSFDSERWEASVASRGVLAVDEDWLSFLWAENGGEPRDQVVVREGEPFRLRELLGITGQAETDVFLTADALEGRLPADTLPFGRDDAGNLFLLEVGGLAGQVLFWDHEQEAKSNNVLILAESFRQFAAMLRGEDALDVPDAVVKSAWIDPDFLRSLK